MNRALFPLPLGAVRPAGWLQKQLQIQADGLTGHLDEFWPDVSRSQWIGGDAEGWERGPYWLDGAVPLAFLLNDDRLKARVTRWIDLILQGQHQDGWLGPQVGRHAGSGEHVMDPWPIFVLLKAMTQFHSAARDERVVPAMLRVLRRIDTLLNERPLESWAKMRWPDLAVSVQWLYDRTGESWLRDLLDRVVKQGYNWRGHFETFQFRERQPQWLMENHVVNHAMALKEPAVQFWRTGDCAVELQSARDAIATLDRFHGQAVGVFTGDESLAGLNPSQGTELCAVVEYLYSLEVLLEAFGEVEFADRRERIAFNALPATFKPDMWAHQYDQQANQVICQRAEDPIYTNNGPDSNLYGLEPNFGCCTANMHQGWPKFAASLWMQTADRGLAALSYAPCELTAAIHGQAVQVSVTTNYPFADTVEIRVVVNQSVRFPLKLRIPAWTEGAAVETRGRTAPAGAGSFHTVERDWTGETTVRLKLPAPVRLQTRFNGAVTVERGPIVYALGIGEEWKQTGGELPHADWEVHPTTPWNYGLEINPENPSRSLAFESGAVGDCPFSPEGAPIRVLARGRRLPNWGLEHDAAAPPPPSPVSSPEPLEEIVLLPYGCTNLRVTEIPRLKEPI